MQEMSIGNITLVDMVGSDCQRETLDSSFEYWDDAEKQNEKVFNVEREGGFFALEQDAYLQALFKQLSQLGCASKVTLDGKRILTLAAGTCWLESWWLRGERPKQLVAIDFSKYRLHHLAPLVLKHYEIDFPVKLVRADVSSALNGEKGFDVVVMSQAFHHFEDPIAVLRQVKNVLNPEGSVFIVGEHYFGSKLYWLQAFKHFVKLLLNFKEYRSKHLFFPAYRDLFPPCIEKGDIHYSPAEYDFMFRKVGGFERSWIVDQKAKIQGVCLQLVS